MEWTTRELAERLNVLADRGTVDDDDYLAIVAHDAALRLRCEEAEKRVSDLETRLASMEGDRDRWRRITEMGDQQVADLAEKLKRVM